MAPWPQRGHRPSRLAWKTLGLCAISAYADGPLAPHIDAGEQEHHVDEMPVPGRRLEAEVACRRELAGDGAEQAHRQEDRADDHVEAMKAGRHEKGRTVNGVEIAYPCG